MSSHIDFIETPLNEWLIDKGLYYVCSSSGLETIS